MTRKQIVDYVMTSISAITDKRCNLVYHNETNKYDKEFTYNTFEVEGRKKWKFGIWILTTDDKKSYNVYLFGEHKWYIDVFKPSEASISFKPFEVGKRKKSLPIPTVDDNGYNAPSSVWDMGLAITNILNSSLLSRIKYYWKNKRVAEFIIGDTLFYTIVEPLKKWYRNYGMIVPLTISKFFYKLRFGKKVSVNIYPTREFFSPKWSFQVIYNTEEPKEVCSIYKKINKDRKSLFLPTCIYQGYVHLVNTTDKEDIYRGFYIDQEILNMYNNER